MDGWTNHLLDAVTEHGYVSCLIPCPDCGLPAEVIERFTLASTAGPVEHVGLSCIAGHAFRLATDRLPAESRDLVAAWRDRGSES
jgi:hypothetical protein